MTWISVEDELPEYQDIYWGTWEYEIEGYFGQGEVSYDPYLGWQRLYYPFSKVIITHWMPLPDLPEK